jgi:hypothetical protein
MRYRHCRMGRGLITWCDVEKILARFMRIILDRLNGETPGITAAMLPHWGHSSQAT